MQERLNEFEKLLETRARKLQRKIDYGEITGTAEYVEGILHKFEKTIFLEVFA